MSSIQIFLSFCGQPELSCYPKHWLWDPMGPESLCLCVDVNSEGMLNHAYPCRVSTLWLSQNTEYHLAKNIILLNAIILRKKNMHSNSVSRRKQIFKTDLLNWSHGAAEKHLPCCQDSVKEIEREGGWLGSLLSDGRMWWCCPSG